MVMRNAAQVVGSSTEMRRQLWSRAGRGREGEGTEKDPQERQKE